ncbi:MAG: hypothetical protein WBN44_16280 [Woeseiaceae bacterium]
MSRVLSSVLGTSREVEGSFMSEQDGNTWGMGVYIALGAGMGTALGAAFGAAFGNVAMGAAFGPAIGASLGIALWAANGGTS